jgi:hypothetical protein
MALSNKSIWGMGALFILAFLLTIKVVSADDRYKFKLIAQKAKDAIPIGADSSYNYYSVDIELQNTSADTVHFVNFNCSKHALFRVESRTGLEVGQFIVCSKNHPISITILPHGTYHTCLVLHRSNVGQRKTSGKFRIGFPYVNPAVYFNIGGGDFISSLDERGNTYLKEGAYMLWSNYLTIEKSDPLHKD